MVKGGIGGGNTRTGLIYEGKVDLATFLSMQNGYSVNGTKVYYKGEQVALVFKKHEFYTFLNENGKKTTPRVRVSSSLEKIFSRGIPESACTALQYAAI